jgi:putative phage-type endonuclease
MAERYAQAIRLASTLKLSRDEWLRIRQLGIGSSDAAPAIGLSPYKCPLSLWLEKTGRKEPEDLSEKEPVIWGTILEPILARVYAERTGRKVRRVNAVLQHPTHRFMLANLDREVRCPKKAGAFWKSRQPVITLPRSGRKASRCLSVPGAASARSNRTRWADVAVLIGGQDFRIYRVNRDEDKIADLIARETVFWQHVVMDTQPAPDGSDDAGAALSWLFPRDDGQTIDLSESIEGNRLFSALLAERQRKEDAEARKPIRQQIQNVLGHASAAVFQSGRITWKRPRIALPLMSSACRKTTPPCSPSTASPLPVPGALSFRLKGNHHDQGSRHYPARDRAYQHWQAGAETRTLAAGEGRQLFLTTQVQSRDGWLLHPLHQALSEQAQNGKIRAIPIQLLFNDSELNLRAEYSAFDRNNGRPVCVGNGETARRVTSQGMEEIGCMGQTVVRWPRSWAASCMVGSMSRWKVSRMSWAASSSAPPATTRCAPWQHG